MTVVTTTDDQTSSLKLPFDPITILVGFVRRWKLLVAILIVSAFLGGVAAKFLGSQTFEAETILLYMIPERTNDPTNRTPPLSTQVQMVKINSNLETVIERLKLDTSVKNLRKAVEVRIEKKTSLVYISVHWNSARLAAEIANTLRDVYVASQLDLRRGDTERELKEVEANFSIAYDDFKQSEEKFQNFISDNKIIDLPKDIQIHVEQISSRETLLANSQNEIETLETQKQNLKDRIEALREKVAKEKTEATATTGLADLNIRIERLRRAIHDDKEQRKGNVELVRDELAFVRAKELFEKGLISQQEFEKSKAEYESKEVQAVDTEEIKEWKRQLKTLEEQVIPKEENFKSPTQELLQNLQSKVLEMELQEVSLKKRISHVTSQIESLRSRLETLTHLQRQYNVLSKDLSLKESRKLSIEQDMSRLRKEYDSLESGYVIVSNAQRPTQSIKSNKKIIFAIVLVLGTMIGYVAVLASELMDTTIKSAAELSAKFSRPILGTIPKFKGSSELFPTESKFPLIEMFRMIVLNVRREVPKRGAVVMLTSAERWEGKTFVAANLGACLGRQDERVLLMDAEIRTPPSEIDLRYMIPEKDKPITGLGEWLSFEALSADEIIWPTELPGVECIPRIEASVTPDLLGSSRMKELIEGLSERFGIILIDGPPVASLVDAELLAQWCDAIIFVVRSRMCPSSKLKKSVERITSTGTPIAGFILNDVDQLYLKLS
ncbi:MAG: hypothetical protein PHS86_05655 [Syntrophaceae bacterium]|nr:hypothetical protein [Syntrophaceae bacterium]